LSRQVLSQQASALDAWVRLIRGHASVTREISAELEAEHGLTINDYEALLHLARAEDGRMRRVDLAQKLILTASGVTRLLDGLERAGWVERASCSSDRRVTYAVLTGAGRDRLEAASGSHIASIRSFFEELFSESELEQLAGLLGRLPGASAATDEDCAPPEENCSP
jgi:DNA-binding MarR family transcriptional regulator